MAHSFSTNNTPANGAAAFYLFLATLVAAGWTKTKDSDGTTYSATGVQITGANTGANGLQNNSAWFVMRSPNSIRQFSFQRGTTNLVWRIKYSYAAGFIGGVPDAVTTPSATDEQILLGGGTDAAPTFATALPTDGGYRFNVCAGDVSVGYGFYWLTFQATSPLTQQCCMLLDVLTAGSYPSADVDPAILIMHTAGDGSLFVQQKAPYQQSNASYRMRGYFGLAGVPTWTSLVMLTICDNWQGSTYAVAGLSEQAGNNSAGTNGWTNKDDLIPIPYGRPKDMSTYGPACASFGWKGFGTLQKYPNNYRANMDTLSVVGVKDFIYFNGSALPWDGSTPTI